MDVLTQRVIGPLLQLAGAVAVVVGLTMWLGWPAAWIGGGLVAILAGFLLEIPDDGARFVVLNEGEEVTISDEGTGTTD